MPHISPNKLPKYLYEQVFGHLAMAVQRADTKASAEKLLLRLLSPTERTMLAKRFAIICMLQNNVRPQYIHKTLQVSHSTIARIAEDKGCTKAFNQVYRTKKERDELWNVLDALLRAGLPPIAGRGRWPGLRTTLA
jgi:Trp operon repressor